MQDNSQDTHNSELEAVRESVLAPHSADACTGDAG
jgi:hypothetical protein